MTNTTTASYKSQYIRNYTEDTPVSNRNVKSIVDNSNKPLVFTHGSDNKLYVIVQRDGNATGWEQVNLTASLGETSELTSFDVYQDEDSKLIRLCAALKNEKGGNGLFITDLFETSVFNAPDFPQEKFWTTVTTPKDEIINHILVDPNGAFITTQQQGKNALYYRIDENKACTKYQFTEDTKQIQDIRLGQWEYYTGLFFLYGLGSEQTVCFHGFPDNPQYPTKFYKVRFDHAGKVDGIAIAKSRNSDNHDLYIAGEEGLFCYNSEEGRTDILQATKEISFKNLQISQHDDTLSCWFLDSSNKKLLYYMYNEPSTGKWSVPVALKSNIEQYTCVRSEGIRNHLFYIDNGKSLFHFFEDEISSLWHDNFVPIEGTGTFKKSAGYLTEVKLGDHAQSAQPPNTQITLTSPVNIYISVDGAFYQVGPDMPINIPFNGQDSIYISHTLNFGFVDAVLCLKAPFLEAPLAIDMAKSVYDRIKQLAYNDLKDVEDLKRRDGTPLLPDEYRNNKETRKKIAEALRFMVDFRDECRNNNICGVYLKSDVGHSQNVSYVETMSLSISGVAAGAAIGGIAGATAFMGGALLIPKDPISETALLIGTLLSAIIGAIIGGAIGWTLQLKKTKKPADDNDIPDEPPTDCPGLVFKKNGCKGKMIFYSDRCAKAIADMDVNHMFSSINMLLAFVGIPPSELPDWPTDNDDCVYNAHLN